MGERRSRVFGRVRTGAVVPHTNALHAGSSRGEDVEGDSGFAQNANIHICSEFCAIPNTG